MMENMTEPSSSISFASSHVSYGSIDNKVFATGGFEAGSSLEIIRLSKLSCNLEQLLGDSSSDFSDASIVVENILVSVHRCILAARSKFFHELFGKEKSFVGKRGKSKYFMTDLLPYGKVGYEAFLIFLSYIYTGKLRPYPLKVSTCVEETCTHDACRPAIEFAVELMYASSIFQVSELVSLFQRRLLDLASKSIVHDIIPILEVAFHCQLNQLLSQCVQIAALSNLGNICIEKELPSKVAENIRSIRHSSQSDEEVDMTVVNPSHEKSIKRIHKALDSDDIELVKLLLTESSITLNDVYALHYAAAYCDPKIVSEILSLGLVDINLRDVQGNTVLHVAARRKEPSIIVSLLNKGARVSELTLDGQNAVNICRRLTRPKDYEMKREKGQEANKDWMCIDVLEREMRRNPTSGDASGFFPELSDDLHMKLLYLEDRVAFARMFFPTEAKLAMDIAHAETSELAGLLSSRGSSGTLVDVDLNETPVTHNKKVLSRIETLSRTAELGRRYFPHCSLVLDKFMEDDLPDIFYLEKGTSEEQRLKRTRFMELKDEVQQAFSKDKAELHRSGFCSSSSSPSCKDGLRDKARKL